MNTLIGNRYEILKQLGAGGMGAVWLVKDKLRDQDVALKQVLMPDNDQRLAITREFRTLSTLRHPNIVSVIEYGSHENQPYFTMEYLPASQPLDKLGDASVERFVQMLQALGYLHRRGVLHRDLKPGNVLVTADGRVKVLDFGLARDNKVDKAATIAGVAGTFNYMAPEIVNEEPPTIASDLWSVGVMLCEALTGHHPFETGSVMKLMVSVMNDAPNLHGMDEALKPVVQKLLAKQPEARYSSAMEVIHDLCTAAKLDVPSESREQRESFLQAAAFVGREREYQALIDGLQTAADGTSQLWLIGGESGVGKSRLLDEVRTRALVDGFVVLQGQGVEGGGLPFQLWRDPARKLTLGAPISELNAAVLKELVPDIAVLLNKDVADAPALLPQANRDRLTAALIERLETQSGKFLIILEDLHWAQESLEILKLLMAGLTAKPIMVIGSFRHDEAPTLPTSFPNAHLLLMERLTAEDVAALSASMIGAENATPLLVDRLARETEGNALFMVEVMRSLAEEAGGLHAISSDSWPERLLAGGMMAALKRRLSRVPENALDTLRLAAVLGRMINLPVLKAAGVDEVDQWLQTCAEVAVLEPYGGEWRFSHDRLREALLQDLPNLPALHEKAARALEAVYPDNVSYAEALAQHWRMAGNAEKEVQYIIKAAEQLIQISGEYERAVGFVEQGLALNLAEFRPELYTWLGFAAERMGQYDAALAHYDSGLAADPTPRAQAMLLNRKASVYWLMGRYPDVKETVQQARTIAEEQNDRSAIAYSLHYLAGIGMVQGDYETARKWYTESLSIRRELGDRLGIAGSLNNLGNVEAFQANHDKARAYYEESLAIRRELGERQGVAASLNNLGLVATAQRQFEVSSVYLQDALSMYRTLGDRQGSALTLTNLGRVSTAQEDYQAAQAYHEESLSLRRGLGDQYGVANSYGNLGLNALGQDNYQAASTYFSQSVAVSREIGVIGSFVWALGGQAIALAHLDEPAREVLLETLRIAREIDSTTEMQDALVAACYVFPSQAAAWIGFLREQATADTHDRQFKRLAEQVQTSMGDAAFNAAVERGKSLDLRAVFDDLIKELEADLVDDTANPIAKKN